MQSQLLRLRNEWLQLWDPPSDALLFWARHNGVEPARRRPELHVPLFLTVERVRAWVAHTFDVRGPFQLRSPLFELEPCSPGAQLLAMYARLPQLCVLEVIEGVGEPAQPSSETYLEYLQSPLRAYSLTFSEQAIDRARLPDALTAVSAVLDHGDFGFVFAESRIYGANFVPALYAKDYGFVVPGVCSADGKNLDVQDPEGVLRLFGELPRTITHKYVCQLQNVHLRRPEMDPESAVFVGDSKTANMFTDISRAYQFSAARDHVTVYHRQSTPEKVLYLVTALLNYYLNTHTDVAADNVPVKKDGIYLKRHCQASRGVRRFPAADGTEPETVDGRMGTRAGRDYYLLDGVWLRCPAEFPHLIFNDSLYSLGQTCYPCCSQRSRRDLPLTKICTGRADEDNLVFRPIVVDGGRDTRLRRRGVLYTLPANLNEFFNHAASYHTKSSVIVSADRYVFYQNNSGVRHVGEELSGLFEAAREVCVFTDDGFLQPRDAVLRERCVYLTRGFLYELVCVTKRVDGPLEVEPYVLSDRCADLLRARATVFDQTLEELWLPTATEVVTPAHPRWADLYAAEDLSMVLTADLDVFRVNHFTNLLMH